MIIHNVNQYLSLQSTFLPMYQTQLMSRWMDGWINGRTDVANISPKVPNSADTPTKLNAPTGVELNDIADQHSSLDTKLSRHTY